MLSTSILLVFVTIFVNHSFATRYGTPDNRRHQYAGYLGIPRRDPAVVGTCTALPVYSSCGGSLVSIPGFPERRIFLTGRHCVILRTNQTDPFMIHFGEFDKRILVNVPGCVNRTIGFVTSATNPATVYTARYVWYPELPKSQGLDNAGGSGIGLYGSDYAIILLDRVVTPDQVNEEAVIFDSSRLGRNINLAVIGTVGYGIVGYGTRADGTLGKPIAVIGDRNKNYVELDVTSVQPTNILASMNAAKLEEALCSGDSGSGGINPMPDINGAYNIYGVVVAGDVQCRAVNTYSRVGTAPFWTWLNTIIQDVLSKV